MKRLMRLVVAITVVVAVMGIAPIAEAAQQSDTVTVTVRFALPEPLNEGDRCAMAPADLAAHPAAGQLVVRNANGTITGTLDLVPNPLNPESTPPGEVEDEACVISEKLRFEGQSFFYTFAVDGVFAWTMGRADLDSLNWTVVIPLTAD